MTERMAHRYRMMIEDGRAELAQLGLTAEEVKDIWGALPAERNGDNGFRSEARSTEALARLPRLASLSTLGRYALLDQFERLGNTDVREFSAVLGQLGIARLSGGPISGSEIRARRSRAGLTQGQLASRLGLRLRGQGGQVTISRWERSRIPRPSYVRFAIEAIERQAIEIRETQTGSHRSGSH